MRWFDRWLMKRVQNAYNANSVSEKEAPIPIQRDDVEDYTAATVRFNITPARGGSVVTVMRYDQRKDHTDRVVYVIDESADLSKRVSEIVTMEMYRS